MKIVVPVARHSDCDLTDTDHANKWQFIMDEHGVKDTICPEHGRTSWFDQLEFEDEAAYEAWRDSR